MHFGKVYLGNAAGDFKKRFYNHRNSFNNETSANDTTFPKYIWKLKEISNLNPTQVWTIAKKVPPYSNISKKCLLRLHEKLKIINYPRTDELLNKKSELISKCRRANKLLLRNYKTKHWLQSLDSYVYIYIAKSVRASERNSVVVRLSPTQTNFL